MRVLIFAPCLLLFSCNNGDDNPKENTNHFDSSVVKVDHNQKINDLQVEMDSIQPLLDSLKEEFIFKQQDLNGRSYYHKNWHGNYYIADDALMAGVDSVGNFFMISNVRGGGTPYENFAVEVHLPDSVYRLDVTGLETSRDIGMELLCACYWEVNFHQGPETDKMGARLFGKRMKYIKGQFLGNKRNKTFGISYRDLPGIQDSYGLSLMIKDSIRIASALDSLNSL